MPQLQQFLQCPGCQAPIDWAQDCQACAWKPPLDGPIIDLLASRELDGAAGPVSAFYNKSPFPGYDDDDAASLLDRAQQTPFIMRLDEAIPANARVLDAGCGTGQVASILALRSRKRTVVGIDATLGQLKEAARFKQRVDIPNIHFLRADLFNPPILEGAFDVVISRGVVHHTWDPVGAMQSIARCVAPGGYVLLGYYDGVARMAHRWRRLVSKMVGRPIHALDPILRRADLSEDKKKNWIQDQYFHPVEKQMSLGGVKACFEKEGFDWIRSVPPVPAPGAMFTPTPRPGLMARGARRFGWMLAGINDQDAGLVCVVARKRPDQASTDSARS